MPRRDGPAALAQREAPVRPDSRRRRTGNEMHLKDDAMHSDIQTVLEMDNRPGKWKRYIIIATVCLIAAGAAAWAAWGRANGTSAIQFQTAQAAKGDLVVTVSATGTLEPVNQVDVGTELSGTLKTVEVDYNDPVVKGQVLARLDTTKLQAQKLQYEAALAVARADLLDAQADLANAKSTFERYQKTFQLSGGRSPSRQDLDSAEAAYKKAAAQVQVAQANILKSQASIDATVSDLEKSIIRSPFNGMVLERSVEPGQTVAASMQTPVLFTLAEDLKKMDLKVAVDEADVGLVKEGQPAVFSVDAYPDRRFQAHISQVRYNPQTDDDVVTYECLLTVDNSDLLLRPGMTATADITVNQVKQALLVPNAALRFTPPLPDASAENSASSSGGFLSKLMPRPPRRSNAKSNNGSNPQAKPQQRVWVLKDGLPEPILVAAGMTDGVHTQVLSGDVQPGQDVLIDVVRGAK